MSDRTPRRWLTFSLRSLFVLVLIIAAYFAGWRSATRTAEREKDAAVRKAVEELQTTPKREHSFLHKVPVYTVPDIDVKIGNFSEEIGKDQLPDDGPPTRSPREQP